MTSAPSLPQRLNGNRFILFLLFITLLYSCAAKKTVGKTRDTTPPSKETDDKVRVYDPATGTYVLVPRDAVKVDTVKWTEEKSDPILTDKDPVSETSGKKSLYEVSLLVPLNSNAYPSLEGYIDPKLVRFMQYYGGMRIAASDIDDMGLPVVFRTYDTENETSISSILQDPGIRKADVIVGPYEKENIEKVAAYGLENEKIVISPWLPAFNIENENPNFIQVIPGLTTHAEAIMDFIADELNHKKIFLVARNNPTEIQRLALFKKNLKVKTEDLIIDDQSIDLAKTNLAFLLEDPDGTVFVMPYYSRQDETFVNSFMRKLVADKEKKDVTVFGLPQWTSFDLNANYMESLSLHISSPSYLNANHPSYKNFRNKFYSKYFTMPDNQAYLGYDLVMWIAKTIAKEGISGLLNASPALEFGLSSGFNLKPVFKEGAKKPSEMKTPLYYENSKVRILEFRDQDFELVR